MRVFRFCSSQLFSRVKASVPEPPKPMPRPTLPPPRQKPDPMQRQSGQGLLEGLIVLLALLSVWVAIAWIARWQDMGLQASHASRFAAFSSTRHSGLLPIESIRTHFFSGPAHQWADRTGSQLLSPERGEVSLTINRYRELSSTAQPGGNSSDVVQLRKEWEIEDAGIVSAVVSVSAQAPRQVTVEKTDSLKIGLAQFDDNYPILSRYTAILTGAGHATEDLGVQDRVASSSFAWNDTASRSYALGRRIEAVMSKVDNGWGRPKPQFDWLSPWSGAVPQRHLGDTQKDGHAYFSP